MLCELRRRRSDPNILDLGPSKCVDSHPTGCQTHQWTAHDKGAFPSVASKASLIKRFICYTFRSRVWALEAVSSTQNELVRLTTEQ